MASQPTLSRLENTVDRRACYGLAVALVALYLYLEERERDGVPQQIPLDLDATDDPTYGDQEGTAYHAYYRQHMYHPLLIFDGDTHHLITAVVRPGNVHASRGVVAILKRLIPVLQVRWPGVRIRLRAWTLSGSRREALDQWQTSSGGPIGYGEVEVEAVRREDEVWALLRLGDATGPGRRL